MNVTEMFAMENGKRGSAAALVGGSSARPQIVSFDQLDQHSARIAAYLRGRGLGAGDPVFLLQPVCVELYVVLLALMRIGAVPVFFDPATGVRHIDACCEALPPRALIATPKAHLLRFVSRGLASIPLKFSTGCAVPAAAALSDAARSISDRRIEPRGPTDTALLTFTSGTSGSPKGVIRSHGLLAAQLDALGPILRRPNAIDLVTLPIFALACLANGGTCIIPDADLRRPDRVDAKSLLNQISAHRVTRIIAAPALIERLLAAHGECERAFAGLRHINTGGGPVFPDLLERLAAAAPQAEITALYGSTEAEPIAELSRTAMKAADIQRVAGGDGLLVGQVAPGMGLEILPDRFGTPIGPLASEDIKELSLPPGEPGEIIVSGANVVGAYLNSRHNRETKIRVGSEVWHRTGDAGYRDSEGRLWLLGRCEARIHDGEGIVYPFSVEAAARACIGPCRVAFASIEGSRVIVVEDKSIDSRKLLSALSWAKIAEIVTVNKIPVDPRHNSKIDHAALVKMLRRGAGRRSEGQSDPSVPLRFSAEGL